MLRSPSKKKGASSAKRVTVSSNPSGLTNSQTLVAHEPSAEDKPIQSPLASTKAYSILRNANGGQSYEQNRLEPKLVHHLPPAPTISADLDEQLGNILEDNSDQHSQSIPKVISPASTTEYASPRYITVSLEDLEQAGIDVQKLNQLSESQIQNLLAIKEQNNQHSHQQLHATQSRDLADLRSSQQMTQNQAHFPTRGSEMERTENMDPDDSSLQSNGPPLLTPEEITPTMAPVIDSSQQPNGNNGDSQITITITDDGSLKLTDASHQTFFFSRDELSQRNIDASNLTDANIQEIIQMALPSLVMAKSDVGSPPLKKRQLPHHSSNHKIQDPISTASLTSRILPRFPNHNGAKFTSGNSRVHRPTYINHSAPSTSGITAQAPRPIPVARALYTAPPSTGITHPILRAPHHNEQNRKEPVAGTSASVMIGEEVEVRRQGSGRRELAIVKYHRPGFGYKVQFSDGRFEWITENNMQGRTLSGNYRSQPNIGRFQSQSSSSEIRPIRRILTSLERSRAQRGPIQNQIRSIIAPLPSTMAHQKQRHFIGGTKSVVINEEPHHNRPSTSKATEGHSNHHFYCSVCDQHVTQSELSYIVIRVLACKPCSSSKVLVLDDDRDHIIDNLTKGTATNTANASQNRTPSDIPPIQQNHGRGSCNSHRMITSTDGMIASSTAVKRKLNSPDDETVIPPNPEEITLNNDQNDKS